MLMYKKTGRDHDVHKLEFKCQLSVLQSIVGYCDKIPQKTKPDFDIPNTM